MLIFIFYVAIPLSKFI